MKHTIGTYLCLVQLLLLLLTVPAGSQDTTVQDFGSGQEIPVYANIRTRTAGGSDTLYSVDISWGSMEFDYTARSEKTWDPKALTYAAQAEGGAWSVGSSLANELNANQIKLKNCSNAPVFFSLAFQANASYPELKGTFTDQSGYTYRDSSERGELADPSQPGVINAGSHTATVDLTLKGDLGEVSDTRVAVGTITVWLHKELN